ncbi:hypothetical protein ESZ50_00505 [Weissella muntiaci]|uniref:Uncharacterized protein n=1 Tax=Weissella muntiaci TaxID=2508881 RepID=A0A6C2CAG7_9LACO|nr:hypothetical protein [Weissella muntiaci]TYC51048.1 hypothetical protein ESZ50_00505 [Weissella muntiaci]
MFPFKMLNVNRDEYIGLGHHEEKAQSDASLFYGDHRFLSFLYSKLFVIFNAPGLIFDYLSYWIRVAGSWVMTELILSFKVWLLIVFLQIFTSLQGDITNTITSSNFTSVIVQWYIYFALPIAFVITFFGGLGAILGENHIFTPIWVTYLTTKLPFNRRIPFFIPRVLVFKKQEEFWDQHSQQQDTVTIPYIYDIDRAAVSKLLEDNYDDIIQMNINVQTLIKYLFLKGQLPEWAVQIVEDKEVNRSLDSIPEYSFKDQLAKNLLNFLRKHDLIEQHALSIGVTDADKKKLIKELKEQLSVNFTHADEGTIVENGTYVRFLQKKHY